ncbi:MAG: deoxyribose-phosphate aldolase, partial [Candidatus Micrarchaeota archaeon]|nr:deoxyribose-phosphate aldolase [Candidatus Micrarchaeota archaeon]
MTAKMTVDIKATMKLIDHTLLKPYASTKQIGALVEEAAGLGVYCVCVNPFFAKRVRELINIKGYDLKLAVVIDFPFGASDTKSRKAQIKSMKGIADEVDIVIQQGPVKDGDFDALLDDLKSVSAQAHSDDLLIKVIVEDAHLEQDQRVKVYEAVFNCGADFINTSTGFGDGLYSKSIGNGVIGATIENVKLMNDISQRLGKTNVGIKASGGVRTYSQLVE